MKKISKTTIIVSSVLGVVLASALVYYNFIDKEKTADIEDGYGYEVGDKCVVQDIQLIHGEEGFWNVKNNIGKISIINFWATWCAGCVKELPDFDKVFKNYSDEVSMIAIHQAVHDETEVNTYINKRWPTFTLSFGLDNENSEYYVNLGGKGSWPMTLIVDQEGIVRYRHVEEVNETTLTSEIESLKKS